MNFTNLLFSLCIMKSFNPRMMIKAWWQRKKNIDNDKMANFCPKMFVCPFEPSLLKSPPNSSQFDDAHYALSTFLFLITFSFKEMFARSRSVEKWKMAIRLISERCFELAKNRLVHNVASQMICKILANVKNCIFWKNDKSSLAEDLKNIFNEFIENYFPMHLAK